MRLLRNRDNRDTRGSDARGADAPGVLVAVTVSEFVSFSWWPVPLLIAGTLILGHALRLDDALLEVPISAMLIVAARAA